MKSIVVAPLWVALVVAGCAIDDAERPERHNGSVQTAGSGGVASDASLRDGSGGADGATQVPPDGAAARVDSGEASLDAEIARDVDTTDAVTQVLDAASDVEAGSPDTGALDATAEADARIVDASAEREADAARPADATIDAPLCANTAIRFNGSNAYVNVVRPVQDDFTIEAWFRTASSLPGPEFFNGYGLFWADVNGTNNDFGVSITGEKITFGVGNPDFVVTSLQSVTTDRWTHLAVTRERATGNMAIFLNGVLDAAGRSTNTGSLSASGMLTIGGNVNNAHYYPGYLDEVRFWSVVRSAADIAANMNRRLAGNEAGLAAYYRFDTPATTVNVAVDSGPNARNGNIVNTVTLPPSGALIYCP